MSPHYINVFLEKCVLILGLGHTVDELKSAMPESTTYFDKTLFSMCIPTVMDSSSSSSAASSEKLTGRKSISKLKAILQ